MKKLITLIIIATSIFQLDAQVSNLSDIISDYEALQKQRKEETKRAWSPNSAIQIKESFLTYGRLMNRLKDIDKETIEGQDLINYELLYLIFQDNINNLQYGNYMFPLNAEGGFILNMSYATRNKKLNNNEEAEDYLAKLQDTRRYIDQQIYWMEKGLEQKKVMPKLVVNNCLAVLHKSVASDADFLMQPFEDAPIDDKYKAEAQKLLTMELIPWLKKLENFLKDEYLAKTYDQVGISNNKDGKRFYEQRVRYYTTLDMTPQQVYDTGKKEVARIRAEMEEIIKELDYDGSFQDFISFLREDEQFYAKTPQELLNHAAWYSMKAQEILPRYFKKIPRLPFTVKAVPAAIAPTYTTGRYSGGSHEDCRPGAYLVNTYNLPARPKYVIPALTMHEAVPGHHLQISLAKEIEGLPKFRTQHYLSAFGEGWGLYSEYLGKEAGIYKTAYDDFGRLTYEMWRACRLVVDPGMHYFGMTREEAVAFMTDNTSLSLHEVNTEIDRYIGWPGQAVSYKIGELKIRELRKLAEAMLGDKFDIRDFHDLVLANGSIPLMTMERIVKAWIAELQKK